VLNRSRKVVGDRTRHLAVPGRSPLVDVCSVWEHGCRDGGPSPSAGSRRRAGACCAPAFRFRARGPDWCSENVEWMKLPCENTSAATCSESASETTRSSRTCLHVSVFCERSSIMHHEREQQSEHSLPVVWWPGAGEGGASGA
jgi:hypothetical protein